MMLTALTCHHPPRLLNAVYDSDVTFAGQSVTFSCKPGYYLPDKTTSRSSECLSSGDWSSPIVDCAGNDSIIAQDAKRTSAILKRLHLKHTLHALLNASHVLHFDKETVKCAN